MAISDKGKETTATFLIGSASTGFEYLALGSGSVAANALGYEFTGSGAKRIASANSLITTTSANDTAQYVGTWTFSSALVISEWGLFNGSVVGDSLALSDVSLISVGSGDTFQLTVKVQTS